jgi:hypothetical protein
MESGQAGWIFTGLSVRSAARNSKLKLLNLQSRSGPLNLPSAVVQLHPF